MIKCLLKFGFRFATIATFAMLPITNLSIAKEEPYFDLPKKDPKEQCEEVARVVRECSYIMDRINWNNSKCGNVFLDGFTLDGENMRMIIYDKNHNIIGIAIGGDDEEELNTEDGIYYEINKGIKYIFNQKNIDFAKTNKKDLKKMKKMNIKNCNANYLK